MSFNSKLHHIGIIIKNHQHLQILVDILGLKQVENVYVPEYKALCFFSSCGQGAIELILPDNNSYLAKFNDGVGGLHHLALEVDDIIFVMDILQSQGIKFTSQEPVKAGNLLVNFVPPIQTRGIIVEYVQVLG